MRLRSQVQGETGSHEVDVRESDPRNVGTEIVATWGEETFSPVQYNTVRVGPFTMKTYVRLGETIAQAFARANAELAQVAAQTKLEKVQGFLRDLRASCEEAKR
jgi:hypothetical protein